MATILPRRRADGTIGYMATIRLHSKKKLVHRETKTFSRRAAAEKWARAREVELEDPAAMVRACAGDVTLASLIRWYIDSFQHISKSQRTKQSQLRFLEKHPTGSLNALSLSAATLIDHVRSRRAKGTGPATVGNDLTWIGVVLRAAKSVKSLPTSPDVVEEARNACRELRLLGKSKRRDRRPTAQELVKLHGYFAGGELPAAPPARHLLATAYQTSFVRCGSCKDALQLSAVDRWIDQRSTQGIDTSSILASNQIEPSWSIGTTPAT